MKGVDGIEEREVTVKGLVGGKELDAGVERWSGRELVSRQRRIGC